VVVVVGNTVVLLPVSGDCVELKLVLNPRLDAPATLQVSVVPLPGVTSEKLAVRLLITGAARLTIAWAVVVPALLLAVRI
jgi:hypothetical protein